MFGRGSIANRTCRCYRKLVGSGLTVAIGGGYVTTIAPYMYTLYAVVAPRRDPKDVRTAVYQELEQIIRDGITEPELEKARKQARAMFAYSCENITNQAYWLGYASMFADPDWYIAYLDNLNSVSPEDVQNYAAKYFRPENCLTGIYSSR